MPGPGDGRSADGGGDPFDLARFVRAQEPVWGEVMRELGRGRKHSHWMWFVFPQLRNLGHSPTAIAFGIASLGEARAYLAHPVLGPRLKLATKAVLAAREITVNEIFGSPDDLKFRSSMTLFAEADPDDDLFRRGIAKCPGGEPDHATLRLLARAPSEQ